MSLGGGANGRQDLLTHAVDNFDRAGMVVAVAAGNEGPATTPSSRRARPARAIAAGASTVGHFVGAPVTVDGVTYGAAAGRLRDGRRARSRRRSSSTGTVNGSTRLCTACPLRCRPAAATPAEIAVVSRGICTFSTKIRNAQEAGAVAVLVVNNVAGDPTAMASDGTPNQPTIPAYMVGLSDGLR